MCAAARALATLLVVAFVSAPARAQVPGISGGSAPSAARSEPTPAPPAPAPPAAAPAPPFTPPPEPPFTPQAPAANEAPAPSASGAPPAPPNAAPAATPGPSPAAPPPAAAPAYVAPVYAAPPAPIAPSVASTPETPPVAPEDAVRAGRASDAHIDRVLLVPTAETHPAGTIYLSDYEIVGLQAGYALSDRTQLSLTFVPPLSRDIIVPFDLTLKGVVVRTPRVRVAATASVTGLYGLNEGNAAVGRVGGITQFCFDDFCRGSLNMAVTVALVGPVSIVADGVGLVFRTGRSMSLLAELQSVLPLGKEGAEIHALGAAVGLRFSGKRAAVDIGLEAPLDRKTKPQAIPIVAVTVRFGT